MSLRNRKMLSVLALPAALALVLTGCNGGTADDDDPNGEPAVEEDGNGEEAVDFPTGPVEYVVPLPEGGGVDTITRLLSPHLSEELDTSVNVVVRAGGAGATGVQHVLNQERDGHTLLAVAGDTVTTGPVGNPEIPFDPSSDLVAVAQITANPWVVLASTDSGIASIEDLADIAETDPDSLRIGISTVMGSDHYALLLMQDALGFPDFRYVTYGGGGPKRLALFAGEIDITLDTAAAIDPDQSVALAVLGTERLEDHPDLPTAEEVGFDGAVADLWIGVMAAADTPADVLDRLEQAVLAAAAEPEFISSVEELGLTVNTLDRSEMETMMQVEREQAQRLLDRFDDDFVEEGEASG